MNQNQDHTNKKSNMLPIGVPFAGSLHREFELRPELVEDFMDSYDDPEHGERALKNAPFAEVCVMARRLTKLGSIPKADITPDLILKMKSRDYLYLQTYERGQLPQEQEGAKTA